MDSKYKAENDFQRYVDISRLKNWAAQSLSPTSSLRGLLLVEKNTLHVNDFLSKMETWLKLSRIETQRKT